jgi:CMP/dCMP kinase
MSLADFNALAQRDSSVDKALDERQLELLRRGGVILEGRLSGWLAAHQGISAFKTWIVCDSSEQIRRLVERDGGDRKLQATSMRDRIQREDDRWSRYGADLSDLSIYDLVLDSTVLPPEALRDRVMVALQEAGASL